MVIHKIIIDIITLMYWAANDLYMKNIKRINTSWPKEDSDAKRIKLVVIKLPYTNLPSSIYLEKNNDIDTNAKKLGSK